MDFILGLWLNFRTGSRSSPELCLYVSPSTNKRGEVTLRAELPPNNPGVTRIVIVSDTHTRHAALGDLPIGDVFVHCGDILMSSSFFSSAARRIQ